MRCSKQAPLAEEVRRAADLLERRYAVSIICVSDKGAVRFNEFQQALGSIPPATLAARLAELERAGILERRVVDGRPPWVEYTLTQRGRQLRALVEALERFARAG